MAEEIDDQVVDTPQTLESQIEEFMSEEPLVFDPEPEPTSEPASQPAVESDPTAEPSAGDEPTIPPDVEPTPISTPEPSAEPTPEPAAVPTELDMLKEQVASLQGIISDLSTKVVTPPAETAKEPDLGIDEILNNVDFDEVMESKEKFVGFLGTLLKAVHTGTLSAVQGVIPGAVDAQVGMAEVRKNFYAANPQLAPVKPYVATVANEVAKANPEWTMQQVLTETAKIAKAALKIPDVAITTEPSTSTPAPKGGPVLPGGTKGSRTPAPAKSALQKQIDEMLED